MNSGFNSGLRGKILEFSHLRLRFFWVSAILIAIKMHVDRDQDEQIPRSGRRLIAIKASRLGSF